MKKDKTKAFRFTRTESTLAEFINSLLFLFTVQLLHGLRGCGRPHQVHLQVQPYPRDLVCGVHVSGQLQKQRRYHVNSKQILEVITYPYNCQKKVQYIESLSLLSQAAAVAKPAGQPGQDSPPDLRLRMADPNLRSKI